MIEKIDHIGIVVKDLKKALKAFSEGLGLGVTKMEHSDEYQVNVAFLPVGEVLIELLEPTGPGMINDFLKTKGEGFHHICYRVNNLERAMEDIGKRIAIRDKEPKPGAAGSRVVFLEAMDALKMETELVERKTEI